MSVFHNSYGKDLNDCKQYLYFIANNEGQDWKDRRNYNNLTVVTLEQQLLGFFSQHPVKK